jgi:hypothetical protein
MTLLNYSVMELNELRRYVLSDREDMAAFQAYIDRSKEEGRMISIGPRNSNWEEELAQKMPSHHHPQEQDYWNEEIEAEDSAGQKQLLQAYLLRIYPESFYGYDAYLDIPMTHNSDITKISSSRLNKKWEVVSGPAESSIRGFFRGDYAENNPPAWVFGLRLIPG